MENGRVMSGSGRGLRPSEALGSDADRVGPAGLVFCVFYDTKLEEEACRNKWRSWLLAKVLGH